MLTANPVALTVADAAASAAISRSLFYKLLKEGRGPKVTKIGRRSVVLVADRDAWLASLAGVAA
jgi:predicted DNA-binding transcriptional regulator AlpA